MQVNMFSHSKLKALLLLVSIVLPGASGCSALQQQKQKQQLMLELTRLQQGTLGTEKIYSNGKIKDCQLAKKYIANWLDYKKFAKSHPEVFGVFKFASESHDETVADMINDLTRDFKKDCIKY